MAIDRTEMNLPDLKGIDTLDQNQRTRILEGIVTTVNEDASTNISPMGPIVDEAMRCLVLRPFQTSITYQNLKRLREGVLHVTDDVDMLARAAVGKIEAEVTDVLDPKRRVLKDACRWYAFRVTSLDDRSERTTIHCDVIDQGRQRDFFGFNRAKHAVLEAAILATRVGILDDEKIRSEVSRLQIWVEKTGGLEEHSAFEYLWQYLDDQIGLGGALKDG